MQLTKHESSFSSKKKKNFYEEKILNLIIHLFIKTSLEILKPVLALSRFTLN